MKAHYVHPYLKLPQHKVTVDLIGVGGTGSQMITGLARINETLMALSHPGIHVRAWDADIVTTANMGRQLFSHSDLNENKATIIINRVNRFFGIEWEAMPVFYTGKERSNILISCVDTAAARINIWQALQKPLKNPGPTDVSYYWLDIGNLQKTGQCVLGTLKPSFLPGNDKSNKKSLKNVVQQFPQIKRIVEEKQGPSCSLVEAIGKQDLFINSTLAQFGCNLIWKLFREEMIKYNGCFLNLETFVTNPIKIQ